MKKDWQNINKSLLIEELQRRALKNDVDNQRICELENRNKFLYLLSKSFLGGGSSDYRVLQRCKFDFEDVRELIEEFEQKDLNLVFYGCMTLYIRKLQEVIDSVDPSDFEEFESSEYELFNELNAVSDIAFNAEFLDSYIFWNCDIEKQKLYSKYFRADIELLNTALGFSELELLAEKGG